MTRLIKFLLALSLLPLSIAWGQNTTITATVVDSDGTVWANAPYTLSFRVNPSQPDRDAYNINGVKLDPTQLQKSGTLSSLGVLSASVYQTSAISPAGALWTLTVCPLSSATACGTVYIGTAGNTEDVSSLINSAITTPRFPALAGAYGYADLEAQITLPVGATYWNVTSQGQRYWNGSTWSTGALPPGVSCSGLPVVCTITGNLNVTGTVAAQTAVSALSPLVDVRAYGAKCDGTTDDTAAIAAAATACGALSTGGTVYIPGAASWGFYSTPNAGMACMTSATVVLPTNCNMEIEGALRASASMTALVSTGSSGNGAQRKAVFGHGLIDPNGLAQTGIFLRSFAHYTVQDISIGAAAQYGIHVGDPTITPGTAGGEAYISNVSLVLPISVAKTPGSIGIFFDNAADNHSINNTVVGYDYGLVNTTGGVTSAHDHCWGGPNSLPTVCFTNKFSYGVWTGDVSDSAQMYGFEFKAYSDEVHGGNTVQNTTWSSAHPEGIHFDVPNPSSGATVEGFNFASDAVAITTGGSANITGVDISGNGCAAVTNCNAIGTITNGPLNVITENPSILNETLIFRDNNALGVGDYYYCEVSEDQISAPTYSAGVITFYSNGTNNGGIADCVDGTGNRVIVDVPNSATPAVSQTYSLANMQNRIVTSGRTDVLGNLGVWGNLYSPTGTWIPSTAAGYKGSATGGPVLAAGILGSGSNVLMVSNTYGCLDGYDHLPCVVYTGAVSGETAVTNAYATIYTTPTAGTYRVSGDIYATTASSTACQVIVYASAAQTNIAGSHYQAIATSTIGTSASLWSSSFVAPSLNLTSGTAIQTQSALGSGSCTGGAWNRYVTIERLY